MAVRGRYGELARRLSEYASELPIGRYGEDVMEMTLGFVVGSPEGRKRARQWLEDPDSYRREAAIRGPFVLGASSSAPGARGLYSDRAGESGGIRIF